MSCAARSKRWAIPRRPCSRSRWPSSRGTPTPWSRPPSARPTAHKRSTTNCRTNTSSATWSSPQPAWTSRSIPQRGNTIAPSPRSASHKRGNASPNESTSNATPNTNAAPRNPALHKPAAGKITTSPPPNSSPRKNSSKPLQKHRSKDLERGGTAHPTRSHTVEVTSVGHVRST